MPMLALVAGYVVVGFVGLLALIVVWRTFRGDINLSLLVSEKSTEGGEHPASMSRFQFLIFTFVIACCLVVLTLESGEFPKIDADVLGLIGISGGSYVVAKGIQKSKEPIVLTAGKPKAKPEPEPQ